MRTQVTIVGGGPAGLLLSHLLRQQNIDSIILERRQPADVLARVRAGVIEPGTAERLRHAGLGNQLDAEGREHAGINIGFADALHRIDIKQLTGGKVLTVYGQTEITKDLYAAADEAGADIRHDAEVTEIDGFDQSPVTVHYRQGEQRMEVTSDIVVGCDGARSIVRDKLLSHGAQLHQRDFDTAWLGVLANVPPVADELVYTTHPNGFALCSQRSATISRCYVQVPTTTQPQDWTDDAFWHELRRRLPPAVAEQLTTGPSTEKSVAVVRSLVVEPMHRARIFLAGDAAHIVPPTGAKGLNLAVADVHDLAGALTSFFAGDAGAAEQYSTLALARTWKAMRFSWWMTNLLHVPATADQYADRIRLAELDYVLGSTAAQTVLAENYIGLSSATAA